MESHLCANHLISKLTKPTSQKLCVMPLGMRQISLYDSVDAGAESRVMFLFDLWASVSAELYQRSSETGVLSVDQSVRLWQQWEG